MRLKYWKGTAGMTRVEDNLNNKTGNYIFPFFWQNGADEQTLQTELLKIYESNIRAFCVEARPHPDYAGEIGLIMPYEKNFCASCNRLRVSAKGKLHLCLFGEEGIELRDLLQSHEQQDILQARIFSA